MAVDDARPRDPDRPAMASPTLDRATRRRLLAELRVAAPWLRDHDLGPAAVGAGPCDRCRDDPRLVPTCGPTAWRALCRECLLDVGRDAFCAGHADTADDLVSRARALPPTWATLVRLAWVASGEVRADAAFLADAAHVLRHDLGPDVRDDLRVDRRRPSRRPDGP